MRNAFADEMTQLAAQDPRLVFLSGDIGNRLFDPFKQQFADRFYNCGVAEANMTGVAAGLALSGMRPITYTITPFNTSRCFEQIKIDVCYQNLPVIIVGVGAGLSYASLGGTHHSCEDIAILRSLPNMTVVCPGDAVEVRCALRAAMQHTGPVYLRIGKKNEPIVHETEPAFELGKGIVLRQGNDICLFSTGNVLPIAMATADRLAEEGVSCQVVSLHTVKPLDQALLREAFERYRVVATLEEHSQIGGLFSALAEWRQIQADQHLQSRAQLVPFAVPDEFLSQCGSQEQAREKLGLEPSAIAAALRSKLLQQAA